MRRPRPRLGFELPAATAPPPPATLGEAGVDLWRRVLAEYDVRDVGGLEMLAQACAACDRTKRVPINRPLCAPVPPEALDLFAAMRERSGQRWWELHRQLAKLLPHKPWDWPVIEDPDAPPGWRPNESARALA